MRQFPSLGSQSRTRTTKCTTRMSRQERRCTTILWMSTSDRSSSLRRPRNTVPVPMSRMSSRPCPICWGTRSKIRSSELRLRRNSESKELCTKTSSIWPLRTWKGNSRCKRSKCCDRISGTLRLSRRSGSGTRESRSRR